MSQKQFGQEIGVAGVVLGAAGDKGLAKLLESNGVDGVEGDPRVGFEEKRPGGWRVVRGRDRRGPAGIADAIRAPTDLYMTADVYAYRLRRTGGKSRFSTD